MAQASDLDDTKKRLAAATADLEAERRSNAGLQAALAQRQVDMKNAQMKEALEVVQSITGYRLGFWVVPSACFVAVVF